MTTQRHKGSFPVETGVVVILFMPAWVIHKENTLSPIYIFIFNFIKGVEGGRHRAMNFEEKHLISITNQSGNKSTLIFCTLIFIFPIRMTNSVNAKSMD